MIMYMKMQQGSIAWESATRPASEGCGSTHSTTMVSTKNPEYVVPPKIGESVQRRRVRQGSERSVLWP